MAAAGLDSTAKLCEICSKLDIEHLTHPFYPCRGPLPGCRVQLEASWTSLALGSIDEIKGRRLICDICKLIAENLDKVPSQLNGRCRMLQNEEFCTFRLPRNVEVRDPSLTHIHLTQASVMFDTSVADQFQGPPLPWERKERDEQTSDYIINFQVNARSCAGVGDLTMPPQTSEQEFLSTVGGRCVAPQVNPQLIRAWLRKCEREHGENCMYSLRSPVEQEERPTFVVDVTQSCLVDTPSRCRYVALSYVWGTSPVFRHLLENTQDLRKRGSLRTLPIPATIRDSMTLVHAIGERYLWVDSICIIQNDLRMQQAEILRMGSIYSKALFTIIAAAGDHANHGLPGVERGSREQVQKILKLADSELLTVIDAGRSGHGIEDTMWAQRAWTFQERVLSNRMLVFSENQVYWSCRMVSHSEERALEEIRDIHRLRLSFPQVPYSDYLSWEPLQPPEYFETYQELLYSYFQERHLTYQTDILNAFSGVSEILGAIQNDTFIWGLPESLFSWAMTWVFIGDVAQNHIVLPIIKSNGSKEMVPLPSWSWSAWSAEDPNRQPVLHASESKHVRPVVDFSVVDSNHQLVRVNERPWQDDPGSNHLRALWKDESPHQLPPLTQYPHSKIGQLHFWTSYANVRTIRSERQLKGWMYILSPPPGFQPDPNSIYGDNNIIQQDFIVVAADGTTLVLLAIEWKDDVAYRIGKTEVKESDWIKVENRQWRLIALG